MLALLLIGCNADATSVGTTSTPDDPTAPVAPAAPTPDTDGSDPAGDGPSASGDDSAGDSAPTGCTAWADPVVTGTVMDGALDEISDLVPSRANPGILWAHEDSGGAPELYALDATGVLVGTLTVDGVTNHDWEDLAIAPCPGTAGDCLWIGDSGDNGLSRDDVAILTVPEPRIDGPFSAHAAASVWPYAFPDGRGNVEGVAVGADGLPWLVTKRVDATADIYRFPTLAQGVTLELVARIVTGDPADEHAAEATSADLSPDGSRLLVRGYGVLWEYPLQGGVPGEPVAIPAPTEPQGEAAAYDPGTGGVWLTSEGVNPQIWFVACRG